MNSNIDNRQRRGWLLKLATAVIAISVFAGLVGTGVLRPLLPVIGYNDSANAPCQWPYSGSNFTIYYDWGSNLQGSSAIKDAFEAAADNWNNLYSSYIPVQLSENTAEQSILNSMYDPTHGAGWTDWNFCGTNRYYSYAYVNTYEFHSEDFQAIAGHELGHVIGLGHSDQTALMGYNPDPEIYYLPLQDDVDGVNDIYD